MNSSRDSGQVFQGLIRNLGSFVLVSVKQQRQQAGFTDAQQEFWLICAFKRRVGNASERRLGKTVTRQVLMAMCPRSCGCGCVHTAVHHH